MVVVHNDDPAEESDIGKIGNQPALIRARLKAKYDNLQLLLPPYLTYACVSQKVPYFQGQKYQCYHHLSNGILIFIS